jgi:hypothetical protein
VFGFMERVSGFIIGWLYEQCSQFNFSWWLEFTS